MGEVPGMGETLLFWDEKKKAATWQTLEPELDLFAFRIS
jgi:hypothetical protein